MDELTLEKLKAMQPGVFAQGEIVNNPEGVYMTDYRKGDTLIWIAKRGGYHDWCILWNPMRRLFICTGIFKTSELIMEEQIIKPETAEAMLTKRNKEITFIRCAGSCAIFQFKDCLISIRAADDGFSMEYVLTERKG